MKRILSCLSQLSSPFFPRVSRHSGSFNGTCLHHFGRGLQKLVT